MVPTENLSQIINLKFNPNYKVLFDYVLTLPPSFVNPFLVDFLPLRESLNRGGFDLDSNTTSESVSLSDRLVFLEASAIY